MDIITAIALLFQKRRPRITQTHEHDTIVATRGDVDLALYLFGDILGSMDLNIPPASIEFYQWVHKRWPHGDFSAREVEQEASLPKSRGGLGIGRATFYRHWKVNKRGYIYRITTGGLVRMICFADRGIKGYISNIGMEDRIMYGVA